MSISDREQIIERMAIYADALDTKDYEGIGACFCDDAQADYAGFTEPLKGRPAILEHMRRALAPLAVTQHMFTNFIVRIDGDLARLGCDILAQHIRRGADGEDSYLAGGKYKVMLRRAADLWRFQEIVARSSWGFGGRDMLPRQDRTHDWSPPQRIEFSRSGFCSPRGC